MAYIPNEVGRLTLSEYKGFMVRLKEFERALQAYTLDPNPRTQSDYDKQRRYLIKRMTH